MAKAVKKDAEAKPVKAKVRTPKNTGAKKKPAAKKSVRKSTKPQIKQSEVSATVTPEVKVSENATKPVAKNNAVPVKKHPVRRFFKWLFSLLLLAVIIVVGAAYYFYNFTDWKGCVRDLIHKYGSQAIGTSVDISDLDVSLQHINGGISNITIANPKGYKQQHLLKLGKLCVDVNKESLLKALKEAVMKSGPQVKTIVIDEIIIDNPQVTYELLDLQRNNVDDILAQFGSADKSSTAEPEDPNAVKYNVAIKKVYINDGVATVAASAIGVSQSLSLNLPTITISDLGAESQGISFEAGLTKVVQAIMRATRDAVAQVDLQKWLVENGSFAKDAVRNVTSSATEATGGVVDSIGNGIKSVSEGVSGLFN